MKKIILLFALFICIANTIIAQWQSTEGIYGADVRSSIVIGSNIFVGTANGVYLSSNNGQNWTWANNGLPNDYIYVLANSGTNIYAGTANRGVFLSTNNGQNWTAINAGLTNSNIKSLAISGGKIFAGTAEGLFISADNGTTWSNNNALTGEVLAVAANGNFVFASTFGAFNKSANGGNSWTSIYTSSNGFPTSRDIKAIALNGTKVVIGSNNNVVLSTNNGETWAKIGYFDEEILTVALRGNDIFVGTFKGLHFSADNGVTWTSSSEGLNKKYIFTVCFNGTNVIAGSVGGLFRANNYGEIWREINNGLSDAPVLAFATDSINIFAGNRFPSVFKMPVNDNKWTNITNNLFTYPTNATGVGSLAIVGTKIFAVTGVSFSVSHNYGDSWSNLNTNANCVSTRTTKVYTGTQFGLNFTTNDGLSWLSIGNNDMTDWSIRSIVQTKNYMFVIGTNFRGPASSIRYSVDDGRSWTSVLPYGFPEATAVTSIDNTIFAGFSGRGVLSTADRGITLKEVNNGLTTINITALTVNNNNIYAGTYDGGIFLSNNYGANWQPVNEGLPTKNVLKLIVAGNYLFAATNIGVFKRPLNELIVNNNEIKDEYNCQISPNPVSNLLTINASDNLIGKKYSIKNILGETIKSDILMNNSTELNVINLANGIYFLHLIGTNKTVKFVKE